MIDLVKRLRTMAATGWNPIGDEAADTITALRAENEKLRAALEKLSCKCPSNCDWEKHGDICPSWVARAALEERQ